MLDPKGFLKKDLDQAVKLHDWFNYCISRTDVELGKGRFHEVKRLLKSAADSADTLESLKNNKLFADLKQEVDRQKQAYGVLEENDRQGIVDKILKWRK